MLHLDQMLHLQARRKEVGFGLIHGISEENEHFFSHDKLEFASDELDILLACGLNLSETVTSLFQSCQDQRPEGKRMGLF